MLNNKILFVVAHNLFRDEEFLIPKDIFEENGYFVDVVSDQIGIAKGSLGYQLKITKSFYSIQEINNYIAICIAGGEGSKKYLWDNLTLHSILHKFSDLNKIIAAICISPVILAKSNLIKNKKVTFYKNDKSAFEIMVKSNCIIEEKNVVVDGNIVTANGPESSEKYGKEIIHLLNKLKE